MQNAMVERGEQAALLEGKRKRTSDTAGCEVRGLRISASFSKVASIIFAAPEA